MISELDAYILLVLHDLLCCRSAIEFALLTFIIVSVTYSNNFLYFKCISPAIFGMTEE